MGSITFYMLLCEYSHRRCDIRTKEILSHRRCEISRHSIFDTIFHSGLYNLIFNFSSSKQSAGFIISYFFAKLQTYFY